MVLVVGWGPTIVGLASRCRAWWLVGCLARLWWSCWWWLLRSGNSWRCRRNRFKKSTCCLGRRQLRASTLQVGQAANNMAISHPQKSCCYISIIHAWRTGGGNWQKVNRRLTKADKRSRGLAPPLIQAKCIRNEAGKGRGCCRCCLCLPCPAWSAPPSLLLSALVAWRVLLF